MPIDQYNIDSEISIALVSMPWSIYNRPSIQLGALKSYLLEQEPALKVDCLHHYLKIARTLGPETYHWLTLSGWAGEALYSPILFPEKTSDALRLFESERKRFKKKNDKADYGFLCQQVEQNLNEWVSNTNWELYDLIGFSVCFNQLLPSLAAANLIKEQAPSLKIVFGGSACGGKGGSDLQRNFSQVDYVIRGEGEKELLELARNLYNSESDKEKSVIDCRENCDLKEIPGPEYKDYFNELGKAFDDMPLNPVIPIEFSRGCWWGKCAFCNLNLQWCGYRSKTAEQMFKEVETSAANYSCLDFSFTDNVLPVSEARNFFRKTAGVQEDYSFFAEIRATQTDDLAEYKLGGIRVVQAGIEALSTGLLEKMNKGVTAIENLSVMKKAQKEGVILEGNLITEFPGSTEDEVQETLNCLQFATPFQPLTTAAFFLGLDSPVDRAPEMFGVRASGPHKNYYRLYPDEILNDQEMLVKDHTGGKIYQRRIWRPVVKWVREWQDFYQNRKNNMSTLPLSYRDGGDFVIIRQEQMSGQVLIHKLRGLSRKIYLYCEEVCELEMIEKEFPMVSYDNLYKFLSEMVGKKLMFSEGKRFISLAVHTRNNG